MGFLYNIYDVLSGNKKKRERKEETQRKLKELEEKGIYIEIVGGDDDFDPKYLDVDVEINPNYHPHKD